MLLNDVDKLATKNDMKFVLDFLMPILNAETTVNVCLHPYNS